MTILSKLDFKSGVKSLVASNKQEIRQINAEKSEHGLKLWQMGLLVGVPSVLLAFYLIYRRNESIKKNNKQEKPSSEKSESHDKKNEIKSEQKTLQKDDSRLTADEKIKNILDKNQQQQNSQVCTGFFFSSKLTNYLDYYKILFFYY